MFIIIMGVAGSGKTTIGKALAKKLSCPFYDGDQFHSPANIAKMAAGMPLNDDDRAEWLNTLANIIRANLAGSMGGVLACSALKESYRDLLRVDETQVKFVYLKGDYSTILARLQRRHNHYMKPSMLDSQFRTLEEPTQALAVDISLTPDEIMREILDWLKAG